jgi:GT2 family glycosyltransferase
MTAGVVVLARQAGPQLAACLRSVGRQTLRPSAVVVLDTTGQAESSRVNAGIVELVRANPETDWVVVLDEDAAIEPEWTASVQALVERSDRVGAVGSRVVLPNRLTVHHAGGYVERPRMVARHFGHARGDEVRRFSDEREVDFVSGCAIALRAAPARQAGLFDESLALTSYGDVDLCDRLRATGWKVVYAPAAVAVLSEHHTIDDLVSRRRDAHRDRLVYALRWLSDDHVRREFWDAEVAHARSDLPVDERRALSLAYLQTALELPDAIRSRLPARFFTPRFLDEMLGDLTLARESLRR